MLEQLLGLERIYRGFDAAARELSEQLQVPLCVPGCGKCCNAATVVAYRIEALFAISACLGDGKLDTVKDCCESWLLDNHKQAPSYEGPQFGVLSRKINEEFTALASTVCPFLLPDKTCLMHRGRPMVCRAYSVTHMPGPTIDFCPRPMGKGETETYRAWVEDPKLRNTVTHFIDSLPDPDWKVAGLLPTMIFKQLEPNKYRAYIGDNKIASAKIVGLTQHYPGMLWQEDMHIRQPQPVH